MPQKPKRRRPGRPKLENPRKGFSVRLEPKLKAAIDKAAQENGRSINREIELRLDKSFDGLLQRNTKQADFADSFGGDKGFALLRILGTAIHRIQEETGKTWDIDPQTSHSFRTFLLLFLDILGPDLSNYPVNQRDDEENPGVTWAAAIINWLGSYDRDWRGLRQSDGPDDRVWNNIEAARMALPEVHVRSQKWVEEANRRMIANRQKEMADD